MRGQAKKFTSISCWIVWILSNLLLDTIIGWNSCLILNTSILSGNTFNTSSLSSSYSVSFWLPCLMSELYTSYWWTSINYHLVKVILDCLSPDITNNTSEGLAEWLRKLPAMFPCVLLSVGS